MLQTELQPGQRLVSCDGDLWRWDGLVALAADMPSAAAQRLEQRNRLEDLTAQTAEANDRMVVAEQRHERLSTDLTELVQADTAARAARRVADSQLADINRALSRAEAEQNLAAGKLEDLSFVVRRHEDEVAAASQQCDEAMAALATRCFASSGRQEAHLRTACWSWLSPGLPRRRSRRHQSCSRVPQRAQWPSLRARWSW